LIEREGELLTNDVNEVINRTALIENLLNQVIMGYSSPRKDAFLFFWEVLLDSSVLPLGSKVKAVLAISQELGVKLNQDILHKVVSYRNAFAHHATDAHPVLAVGKTPEEDTSYNMLYILKASGKIQKIRREDAFEEFNKYYAEAREKLVEIIQLINDQVKENDNLPT